MEVNADNINNNNHNDENESDSTALLVDNDYICDKPYRCRWVDTMELRNNPIDSRYAFPRRMWRGVPWNVLATIRQPNELGFFLGIDDPDANMPEDLNMNLTFAFSLINYDDSVFKECDKGTTYTFSYESYCRDRRKNGSMTRLDQGSWAYFTLQELSAYIDYQKKGNPDVEFPVIKVQISIEDTFSPAHVPANYNSKKITGMVGLENGAATCYLNSLLQMLFHLNIFRAVVYKMPHENEQMGNSATLALQALFRNLQCEDTEVSTNQLTAAFGWTAAERFLQQDVQEMLRVLIDKLEEKMGGTQVDNYTKKLFAGKVRSFVRCVNVDYESSRVEDFYDIQLDVKGCKNIHDSFKRYIETEMLDGENQYDAGEHGKQDAKKGVIFEEFPPVLTIHLKRFDFDFNLCALVKIHDYFEFPERLCLNDYLADNCIDKDATSNTYILHSVLVHVGGNEGGHYYAYIRPTTEIFQYNKDSSDGLNQSNDTKVSDGGQWYKFNDETVLEVDEREAIDSTYGRTPFRSSMGSAYMLVYIREKDAHEVMAPVTEEDIPESLNQRLDYEMTLERAAERKQHRNSMYSSFSIVTEDHVKTYHNFSKTHDLSSKHSDIVLPIMANSTRLSLVLRVADELQLTPLRFRIWEFTLQRKDCYRPTECISFHDLGYDINNNNNNNTLRYFIQMLPPLENEEEEINFNKRYAELRQAEAENNELLRDSLLKYGVDEYYDSEENPAFLCGVGSSNLPLEDLYKYDASAHQNVSAKYEELKDEIMCLLQENRRHTDLQGADMMVFLKIYDPYNLLPALTIHMEDSNKNTETIEEQSLPLSEYCPMKVLRIYNVGNIELLELAKEAKRVISTNIDPENSKDFDADELGLWLGLSTCKLERNFYYKNDPTKYHYKIENSAARRVGGVFYFTFPDYMHENKTRHIPFDFVDPNDWMNYVTNKRTFTVRPFDDQDYLVLQNLRRVQRIKWSKYHQSLQTKSKTIDLTGEVSNISEQAILNFNKEPPEEIPHAFPVNLVLTMTLSELIDRINEVLFIPPQQIIIYLALEYMSLEETRNEARTVAPMALCYNGNDKILDLMYSQKLSHQAHHRYILFYKIMPYPLPAGTMPLLPGPTLKKISQSSNTTNKNDKVKKVTKSCDFIICDARLRQWRRWFLEYVKKYDSRFAVVNGSLESSNDNGVSSKRDANTAVTNEQVLDNDSSEKKESVEVARHKRQRRTENGNGLESNSSTDSSPRMMSVENDQILPSENSKSSDTESVLPLQLRDLAQWPSSEKIISLCDPLSAEQVYLQVPCIYLMGDVCRQLRSAIGVPKNIAILMKEHPQYFQMTPGRLPNAPPLPPGISSIDHVVKMLLGNESNENVDLLELACGNVDGAVCSDWLRRHSAESATSADANNDLNDSLDKDEFGEVTDFITAASPLLPSYPLMVYNIRNNVISEVIAYSRDVGATVTSWTDAEFCMENLYHVGVQCVSPDDILFMRGAFPGVKSMPITVCNFTLLGNTVNVCDCRLFGGPFFTYLREDDDFYSLACRLSVYTGEKTWEKYRLAVVAMDRTPTILPKLKPRDNVPEPQPVLTSSDENDNDLSMNETNGDSKVAENSPTVQPPPPGEKVASIWDMFVEKFPRYMNLNKSIDALDEAQKDRLKKRGWTYPVLGIQRSVADLETATASAVGAEKQRGMRCSMFGMGGIKIS